MEQNILSGPVLEPLLANTDIGTLILTKLASLGEKTLLTDSESGVELTTLTVLKRAIKLAQWLKTKNVQVGDTVAIFSENTIDFCIVSVACFLSAITVAPINFHYARGELKHVINLSKPKVLFVSELVADRAVRMADSIPSLKQIVIFGNKKSYRKVITLDSILSGADSSPLDEDFTPPEINPEDTVLAILSSSGTTGLPKGVMLTQKNILTYLDYFLYLAQEVLTVPQVILAAVPLFHAMGFMALIIAVLSGNLMVVIKKFEVKSFLDTVVKFRATTIALPPTALVTLLKSDLLKNYDLSFLQAIKSGSAPLSKELETRIGDRFNIGQNMVQNYGLTEATLACLVNIPDKPRPAGTVGTVAANMQAKVINSEGVALGPNQEGELCVKGALVMKGYVGNPQATAETIDKDGWLHTGDVAYYDNNYNFFIVDRLKELIKYKSYQVAPAELEALLLSHPHVQDAAVIGLPDEDAGELPLAFVVKKNDSKVVTEKELQDFVGERVSSQKRLRGGVIFVPTIPRNPAGKILRRELRKRASAAKSKL